MQAALVALAQEMRLPLATVHSRLHILGHSLGGAAGLQLVLLCHFLSFVVLTVILTFCNVYAFTFTGFTLVGIRGHRHIV